MTTSAHHTTFPSLTLRNLVVPAALSSLMAAVLVFWNRRTRIPSVSPMSDEWLRNHVSSRDRES